MTKQSFVIQVSQDNSKLSLINEVVFLIFFVDFKGFFYLYLGCIRFY